MAMLFHPSPEGYYHQDLMNPPPPSSTFFDSTSFDNQEVLQGKMKKRKRGASKKSREQIESQRMTHIAVERNRRKQMNQHLDILKSIMPTSYTQKGDQASIIGGAIEFVRELEQLLQRLESEKMRRASPSQTVAVPGENETAGNNSWCANVQVKVEGSDGLIKVLTKKNDGVLSRIIAAVESLQVQIVQASITTTEDSVLSSFSFKMSGEEKLRAEEIAESVQQILSSIHATSVNY